MVRPTTPAEARWIRDLERVLLRCPPTLELLTIGDRGLAVLDAATAKGIDLHDGRHAVADVGHARAACRIHGVSG